MSSTHTTTNRDDVRVPGARRKMARSRGVGSGLAILLLGAWGALIPFVGPYFDFSYTPDKAWHWSAARGWLEVLPGAVAALGGLLLLVSASRAATVVGAWLGIAAGAWFIVGLPLAPLLHLGSPGSPLSSHRSVATLETLALFFGLGALILFFAATAFGRLSVVSQRDVHAAERRHEAAVAERDEAEREEAEQAAAAEREDAERRASERERVHREDLDRDTAERRRIHRGESDDDDRDDRRAEHGAAATAAGAGAGAAAQHAAARHEEKSAARHDEREARREERTATPDERLAQRRPDERAAGAEPYDPGAAQQPHAYDPNARQVRQGQDAPVASAPPAPAYQDPQAPGAPQAGAPQAGAPQAGVPQAGAPQAGVPQAGAPQAGAPQAGAPQASATRTDAAPTGAAPQPERHWWQRR